jgi:hypothetical protein
VRHRAGQSARRASGRRRTRPSLSGLVTPFPIATILVVFAHRQDGAGVIAVYGGFIPSLYSFAWFCAALAFGLVRWPLPVAFSAALAVTLLCQLVVLKVVERR